MSIKKRLFRLRQDGDTIVEVMIVLAVLGLAIGISYSTANRSLSETRQAQENTKATELVQSQIEQLRYLSPNPASVGLGKYIFQPVQYCIDSTNTIKSPAFFSSACTVDSFYHLSITYCQGSGSAACTGHTTDDTFITTATWPDILGQGNDTVTLTYRLHP